jgi:N12 class adenine-specific DNA methylase
MKNNGKLFEKQIENIVLDFKEFNDDCFNLEKDYFNVYNYSEYLKLKRLDINTAINRDSNEFLFFRNFPNNNDLKQKTEFCIVQKTNDNIQKFRIECKSQELQGSSYRTIEHVIEQYRQNKIKSNETALIIVYGGKYYDEKSRLAIEIVNNIKNNIRHSYDILFLNTQEFKDFMNEYLISKNLIETIKKYK